jgi:hypothetical protein
MTASSLQMIAYMVMLVLVAAASAGLLGGAG